MTKTKPEGLAKLGELLKGARICMLTTQDEHDSLRSRPMALQEADIEEDLWFFTQRHSHKVNEMKGDSRVNVSVSQDKTWVSISGTASLVDDKAKAKQLWNPTYKAWFPKGLEDPELILLKVHIDHAEYWDNPGGVVTVLIGYIKALATGEQAKIGENGVIK
jgi:general stress protein 26